MKDQKTKVMKWISVKDELPPKQIRVIILYKEKEVSIGNFLEKNYWNIYGAGYWFETVNVSHWMPLPEPLKK